MIKNQTSIPDKLDLEDPTQYAWIKVSLMDDGDWEYTRTGIGEFNNRVFIVDLDDTGEQFREMIWVKNGLSVEDVLRIGVETGVFDKIDWGYDEDDQYRERTDATPEQYNTFYQMIGIDNPNLHD